MGLEVANFISEMVPENPADTDQVSEADDHMRLIKTAVQQSFPNVDAAVTATPADLNTLTGGGTEGGTVLAFKPGDRMLLVSQRLPAGWTIHAVADDRMMLGTSVLSEGGNGDGTWDNSTGLAAVGDDNQRKNVTESGGTWVSPAAHTHQISSDSSWRPRYIKVIVIQKL